MFQQITLTREIDKFLGNHDLSPFDTHERAMMVDDTASSYIVSRTSSTMPDLVYPLRLQVIEAHGDASCIREDSQYERKPWTRNIGSF